MFEALSRGTIERNEIKWNKKAKSTDDIISTLGGADKTKGSCSSLAFAFIGNRAGGEILDFRGGASQWFFSSYGHIKQVLDFKGVVGEKMKHTNDFLKAREMLKNVVKGKEYYFTAGKHAAIVRRTDAGLEYLELQSGTNNGFHPLTGEVLKNRFGCVKRHTLMRQKIETEEVLIDADSLKNNDEFREMLCYINTDKAFQMKGEGGGVK